MSWTQPVCVNRWNEMFPDRQVDPTDLRYKPYKPMDDNLCCFCGVPTTIYIRIDPATVPFPRSV
jgi:hypothetical protein